MRPATAGMPGPMLIGMLSHAGWGPLTGRRWQGVRSTLRALVDHLYKTPSLSGRGTAYQISVRTGLSKDWTRRCLWVLEGLGVITWNRGGVIDGKPTAGTFRVSKRALAALINLARPINDENTRRHRLETSKRLANLYKLCFRNRGKRLPSSDQEELGKDPHTLKGGECTHSTHRRSISPKKGKEMPAIPSISPDRLAGVHCSHGFARPDRCPQCKLNHLPPNLFAEWDAQRNNAAGGALNPAAAAEPALMGTSADPDVAQLEKQGYAGPALALAMARRKRA